MNYEEIQPNRELRACARGQLKGVWGAMAFTYFVYFLLFIPYYIFSILDSIINSINKYDFLSDYLYMFMYSIDMPDIASLITVISFILSLAVIFAAGPFALGFAGYFLKRVRGEEIATKNIFDGFKRFFLSFGLWFFTGLFTGLWSLLLIIPGIIKIYAYSMAYYIMYDNP